MRYSQITINTNKPSRLTLCYIEHSRLVRPQDVSVYSPVGDSGLRVRNFWSAVSVIIPETHPLFNLTMIEMIGRDLIKENIANLIGESSMFKETIIDKLQ